MLHINRHNKAINGIRKLILSSPLARCFTPMNTGRFNNNPPDNTVPEWLLPCTCQTQKYQCNARLRPDILYIRGLPHQSPPQK